MELKVFGICTHCWLLRLDLYFKRQNYSVTDTHTHFCNKMSSLLFTVSKPSRMCGIAQLHHHHKVIKKWEISACF